MVSKETFWADGEAYRDFAVAIPSDRVAYAVAYGLLDVKEKMVLDVGCFEGKSTAMLKEAGAKCVLGFDKFEKYIERAKQKFGWIPEISFLYVEEHAPIQTELKFHRAALTFVHPTVESRECLEVLAKKIGDCLEPGSRIISLGRHEEGILRNRNFLYYGQRVLEVREDRILFENELRLATGQVLQFNAVLWKEDTILAAYAKEGFMLEKRVDLKEGVRELEEVLAAHNLKNEWLDEWKAPLYQILVLKKMT